MKALILIALLSWFGGDKPCDDVNLSPPMMYDSLIELSTDAPCDLDGGKKEC